MFSLFPRVLWPALAFVLFACIRAAFSADAVVLPSIVVEGTPADALLYDPLVPPVAKPERGAQSPGGSITRDALDEIPVPVIDYGQPGQSTQIRGLGLRVDDTNVQTLGIPLNPPQGGGFNYSSFPQFFWSGFDYHLGPGKGAYDPRAVSGTVSLRPWTSEAIRQKDQIRLTELVGGDLIQSSVAVKRGKTAALFGYSFEDAKGPTGSISSELVQSDRFRLLAHFLGTSIDSKSTGSVDYPTPDARLKTSRILPVIQTDLDLGEKKGEILLKSSFFYDRNDLKYSGDPDPTVNTDDRAEQFGMENALFLAGGTNFALSARRVTYRRQDFDAPAEAVGHLLAGQTLSFGSWTMDGSAEADAVSRRGVRPGASLGARWDFSTESGIFARTGYSEKFPTMLDRYYQASYFISNPDLGNERAWTTTLGIDGHWSRLDTSFQVFYQNRQDAQIVTPAGRLYQTQNRGNARVLSLLHQLRADIASWFEVSSSLRWSDSRIEATGERIPYDPEWTEVARATFRERQENPTWRAGINLRAVSQQYVSRGVTNAGYALISAEAEKKLEWTPLGAEVAIQARVDNLMDRAIEVVHGYPWPGRQLGVGLVGRL